MSTPESVGRDERTVAVENASYRWAYLLLSFALLVDVAYRSLVRQEGAWDLMALVIGAGAVCTAYQARQQVLTRGWVIPALVAACVAAVLAMLLVLALR